MPNPIGATRRDLFGDGSAAIAQTARDSRSSFAAPSGAPSVAWISPADRRPRADRRLDFRRAGDDEPGLVDEREESQRVVLQQRVDLVGQIRRWLGRPARNPRAKACLAAAPATRSRGRAASRRRVPAACAGCRATPRPRRDKREAQHRLRRSLHAGDDAGSLRPAFLSRRRASAQILGLRRLRSVARAFLDRLRPLSSRPAALRLDPARAAPARP